MACVLQVKKTFDPGDNLVAGGARRLVQVDQAKPDVLINRPLVRRTAKGWVSFLVYPGE